MSNNGSINNLPLATVKAHITPEGTGLRTMTMTMK